MKSFREFAANDNIPNPNTNAAEGAIRKELMQAKTPEQIALLRKKLVLLKKGSENDD